MGLALCGLLFYFFSYLFFRVRTRRQWEEAPYGWKEVMVRVHPDFCDWELQKRESFMDKKPVSKRYFWGQKLYWNAALAPGLVMVLVGVLIGMLRLSLMCG